MSWDLYGSYLLLLYPILLKTWANGFWYSLKSVNNVYLYLVLTQLGMKYAQRCMSINLLPAVQSHFNGYVNDACLCVCLQFFFPSCTLLVLPECTVRSLEIWFTLKFCTVINTRRPKSLTQSFHNYNSKNNKILKVRKIKVSS